MTDIPLHERKRFRVTAEPSPEEVEQRNLLVLFFGRNSGVYLDVFDQMKTQSGLVRSWSWAAFFLTLPWLLYRKLWAWAAAAIAIPIALGYLLPSATGATIVPFALYGMWARYFYVQSATKTVQRIQAENADADVVRSKVERAGGVSVLGAMIGGLILALAVVAAGYTGFQEGYASHHHVTYN